MSLHHSGRGRLGLALGAFGASALLLAGCAGGGGGGSTDGGNASNEPLIIGTTDKITSIDPAGSYDNGSFAVMNQIYPFLLNSQYGTADVTPDLAESAEFTSPTEYTVKLKKDLKFANGDDLTSSDVKFSFDRQVKIADPNGPSSLLGNLVSIATPDDTTVVFTLKNANDQTWAQVLSSPAAPIVDEEVFSADAVTPDDDIVKGKAFAGQYVIDSYKVNELISYSPYKDYQGALPARRELRHHGEVLRRRLEPQARHRQRRHRRGVPRASRPPTSPTSRPTTRSRSSTAPVATSATSSSTSTRSRSARRPPRRDPAKALAVRQAAADLIDRPAIAKDVYKDTFTPLYSYVPQGFTGANEALKGLYGDGKGGPDARQGEGHPRGRRRHDPGRAQPPVQRRPLRPLVG